MVTEDAVVELLRDRVLVVKSTSGRQKSWSAKRVPRTCAIKDDALLAAYVELALASKKTRERYEKMIEAMIVGGRVNDVVLKRCFNILRIDPIRARARISQ